jgi:hypothetical protein
MVTLGLSFRSQVCAGTLISNGWVATAAYCLSNNLKQFISTSVTSFKDVTDMELSYYYNEQFYILAARIVDVSKNSFFQIFLEG